MVVTTPEVTVVNLQISNGLQIIDSACLSDGPGETFTWTVGLLNAGESAQCEFEVETFLSGDQGITASAASDLNDPAPANNTSISNIVTVDVIAVPRLSTWSLLLLAGLMSAIGFALHSSNEPEPAGRSLR